MWQSQLIILSFLSISQFWHVEAVKQACYAHMGCFSLESPWLTARRPVPQPDPPQSQKIRVMFYHRAKNNQPHYIQTWPSLDLQKAPYDYKKPTFFMTHGFQNTGSDVWMRQLKDAVLNRTDSNVFIGDWGNGAKAFNFFQAVGNSRMAARQFSNLIQHLIDHYGLDVRKLHCIGHSLGAQICGQIGKSVPGIFQITAMDPSQPMYEGDDTSVRLVRGDAFFVVALHADARPFIPDIGFGFMNEVADVDFYFNSGHGQPGCQFPQVFNTPKIKSLAGYFTVPAQIFYQSLLCPHGLSHVFLTEAIANTRCVFWGYNATMKNMLKAVSNQGTQGFFSKYLGITDTCTLETCSPVGLDTYFWPGRGTFVVTTRGSLPFCINEKGLVDENEQRRFIYKVELAGIKALMSTKDRGIL